MITDLQLARMEHMQAARRVRRLEEELKTRRSYRLDMDLMTARDRQQRAAARVAELEATQQAATLEGAANETKPSSSQSHAQDSHNAKR